METSSAAASDLGVTRSPTITSPALMTGVGALLGTAAYMSPEQARGNAADKRSDLWSFGCILFEMLSGVRPFEGEGVADVLAAVLKLEPDWTRLPPETPASVRLLIQNCLTKDARKRIGDVSVAQFVFRAPADLSISGTSSHISGTVSSVSVPRTERPESGNPAPTEMTRRDVP